MAVKIRLSRMGKKKQPIYKIVAADVRAPRDGKFIEALGIYNPIKSPAIIELKEERINYWLDNGAQPTDTVNSILRNQGILYKRELVKKGMSPEAINEEIAKWREAKQAKLAAPKKKKNKKSVNGGEQQ
ncbi:MAG TPA: 30S ribosomal protein S16 [Ignavibacteriales bacterium]|nr:30S ribosomal protein S16 [Ignavibacteriales bacterium]